MTELRVNAKQWIPPKFAWWKIFDFQVDFVQYCTQSLSISLEISASSLISKLQSCRAITNSELERNIWHVTKKAEIVTTYSASDLSDTRQMIVKVPWFSLAWYCGLWENCLLTSDPEPCIEGATSRYYNQLCPV